MTEPAPARRAKKRAVADAQWARLVAEQQRLDAQFHTHRDATSYRPAPTTAASLTPPAASGVTMPEPHVTPLVRKVAAQLAVDLSTVTGSGVGGRIKVEDIRAAAGTSHRPSAKARSKPAPRAAAARAHRSPLLQDRRSQFGYGTVQIDAFAVNPLLDDLKQIWPEDYAAAIAHDRNVPTMFAGGDVPLFTAAGYEPELVLQLPWMVRHKAAIAGKPTEVAEIFERCGAGTLESVYAAELLAAPHDGLGAYMTRMKTWLYARNVIPVPKAITIDDARGTTPEDNLAAWKADLRGQVGGSRNHLAQ